MLKVAQWLGEDEKIKMSSFDKSSHAIAIAVRQSHQTTIPPFLPSIKTAGVQAEWIGQSFGQLSTLQQAMCCLDDFAQIVARVGGHRY